MTARVSNPGEGPAAMLADVLRRQGVTEDRVSQLGSDLSELGASQSETQTLVTELRRQLDGIADALASLGAAPADGDAGDDAGAVVDWSRLDRSSAETEWQRLYEWLGTWLVPTYRITLAQLRPCWPHHPEVREDLSWLRACWMYAYRSGTASPAQAAEWHTRWLPAALDRIAAAFGRTECTGGQHRGNLLPDEVRMLDADALSEPRCWLDDGRQEDLRAREEPAA